jgi:pyrroloquinoline quinone biosynthesis protein B
VSRAGAGGRYGAVAAALLVGAAFSLEAQNEPRSVDPFTVVLGTAQDGGLPQIGGTAPEDEAARRDPTRRRLVASLLIVDPASGERLLHLGREIYGAASQRVLASDRMATFLEKNGPWELLVRLNNIRVERIKGDSTLPLNSRLSLTAIPVPHRDEYSDTFGFIVRGPSRSILWLPDIDKWEKWDRRIEDVIAGVDVAYVDGTFHDGDELPGRAMSEVPHPFISESLARFASLDVKQRSKIVFMHLNHTNPAATLGSKAQLAIEKAGMRVAREGERLPL